MAKLFNVYCDEYSIGFGPLIYQHKPKGVNKKGKPRETKFSIRCLPLGGYVSMAGEGMEDIEELKQVPADRFINNIAKWKRAIVMAAGVCLNFVLGWFLLLGYTCLSSQINYKATSCDFYVMERATYLENDSNFDYNSEDVNHILTLDTEIYQIEVNSFVNNENLSQTFTINPGTLYRDNELGDFWDYLTTISCTSENDYSTIYFFTTSGDEPLKIERKAYVTTNEDETLSYAWDQVVSISRATYRPNFIQAIGLSTRTFFRSCGLIYRAIGQLFTKSGISSLGGPVAIVQQQMQISQYGFGYFLYFWGVISCNLAIFNLLPLPGLDGWHLLVCIVEGITKRDINPKVKAIMSTIGLVLLFGLMIFVTAKDIFKLFNIVIKTLL
jgi:regulator of sigma E protease